MTSPAPVLPWIAPAIRALLLADAPFAAVTGGRVSTRLGDVSAPCATVHLPPAIPIDASAGAWLPLVQVEGWCPAGVAGDPEDIAWSIASTGAAALCRVRNHQYRNTYFSVRVTDGPITDVDESRGKNNVLHRAFIRAELTVHAR